MARVGGGGIKNQERHGGTIARMEPVASDSAPASDTEHVFGFSVFWGHDSEIGIPGEVVQGGERGRRKGRKKEMFYPN